MKTLDKQNRPDNYGYLNGRPGATLIELLVILWILVFALAGASRGMRFADQYGPWWSLLGAVIGFLAGAIAAILLAVVFGLICELTTRFWVWYRLFPPVCENGNCRKGDYESAETPLSVRKHVKGASRHAYRCNCGNLYTKLGCISPTIQWVRILSDNAVQPYLKHYLFGRWKPDTSDRIDIPTDPTGKRWEIELYTRKNLKPVQEAFFISIFLFLIGPAFLILVNIVASLGTKISLPTNETLLLYYLIPLIIGIGIFIACWVNSKQIAQSIEADDECIRIQRFNKQPIEIQWDRIVSVGHKKDMAVRFWTFRVPGRKLAVSSEYFSDKEWQLLSDYIKKHIPEDCQLKDSKTTNTN